MPSPPQNPDTSVLNANQSSLFWEAPASEGWSRITGYVVYRDGTSTTGGGPYYSPVLPPTQRSFNFGKLIPGASYTFYVWARNAYGYSSPAHAYVTQPAGVPTAPSIGRAVSGKPGGAENATATWGTAAPNGSSVYGYRVTAYRVVSGRTVQTSTSPVLSHVAREFSMQLPHAGQWRFTVVAYNGYGNSPRSAYSNLVVAQ